MATHGKNAKIYARGYNVREFLRKISLSMTASTPDDTAIGDTAMSRVADGIIDGSASYDGIFDDASGAIDQQLAAALGTQDSVWTVFPAGDSTLGDLGYGWIGVDDSYSPSADYDGVVVFSGESKTSGGQSIELVKVLVPLAAKTTSSNSTSLDNAASTAYGGSAYIHCTAATALTSIAVTIKGSATGSFAGEETTIGTFTSITAVNSSERIAFTDTVPRYLRAYWTLVGTSATISVSVHRHNI